MRGALAWAALALLAAQPAAHAAKLADGCARVYVDMGTNVGTQIRKLYEPHLFDGFVEGNPSEAIFNETLGPDRSDVCAFGFEASPRHAKRLARIAKAYNAVGRRVVLRAGTAVMTENKNVTFFMADDNDERNIDIAATTKTGVGGVPTTVAGIDMADWMLREVIGREIPPDSPHRATILMKSDVENNDMEVLSRLLVTGVLCQVDFVYGEHIEEQWLERVHGILRDGLCRTRIILADDETGQGGQAFLNWPLPGEEAATATPAAKL